MSRPLRVVVAGSSAASMVIPSRRLRSEGAYPELLAAALAERGVGAEVLTRSRWFGMIRDLRHEYEQVIRDRAPDVVVLNYGIVECQSNMLPTAVARHFGTWNRSGSTPRRAYRRFVADRVWPGLREYQRRTEGLPTHRMSPRAFRAELTRVIALTRLETRALVLVLEIDPPGSRISRWMPSIQARRDTYQGLIAEVVERFGPDVRLVASAGAVVGRERELAPDGLHRSAEGHRLLAELLAVEIAAWADQPDGPYNDDPYRWI